MIANYRVKRAVVKADPIDHVYIVTAPGGTRVIVPGEAFEALFELMDKPIILEPHDHGNSEGHPKE